MSSMVQLIFSIKMAMTGCLLLSSTQRVLETEKGKKQQRREGKKSESRQKGGHVWAVCPGIRTGFLLRQRLSVPTPLQAVKIGRLGKMAAAMRGAIYRVRTMSPAQC